MSSSTDTPDLTSLFKTTCQGMTVGQVIHNEAYTELRASGATELMNPNIDMEARGIRKQMSALDVLALEPSVLPSEYSVRDQLSIMDYILSLQISMHNFSCALPTLGSCLFMYCARTLDNSTLRAFVIATIKSVVFVLQSFQENSLYDQPENIDFDLLMDIPVSQSIAWLQEECNKLEDSQDGLSRALYYRLKFRLHSLEVHHAMSRERNVESSSGIVDAIVAATEGIRFANYITGTMIDEFITTEERAVVLEYLPAVFPFSSADPKPFPLQYTPLSTEPSLLQPACLPVKHALSCLSHSPAIGVFPRLHSNVTGFRIFDFPSPYHALCTYAVSLSHTAALCTALYHVLPNTEEKPSIYLHSYKGALAKQNKVRVKATKANPAAPLLYKAEPTHPVNAMKASAEAASMTEYNVERYTPASTYFAAPGTDGMTPVESMTILTTVTADNHTVLSLLPPEPSKDFVSLSFYDRLSVISKAFVSQRPDNVAISQANILLRGMTDFLGVCSNTVLAEHALRAAAPITTGHCETNVPLVFATLGTTTAPAGPVVDFVEATSYPAALSVSKMCQTRDYMSTHIYNTLSYIGHAQAVTPQADQFIEQTHTAQKTNLVADCPSPDMVSPSFFRSPTFVWAALMAADSMEDLMMYLSRERLVSASELSLYAWVWWNINNMKTKLTTVGRRAPLKHGMFTTGPCVSASPLKPLQYTDKAPTPAVRPKTAADIPSLAWTMEPLFVGGLQIAHKLAMKQPEINIKKHVQKFAPRTHVSPYFMLSKVIDLALTAVRFLLVGFERVSVRVPRLAQEGDSELLSAWVKNRFLFYSYVLHPSEPPVENYLSEAEELLQLPLPELLQLAKKQCLDAIRIGMDMLKTFSSTQAAATRYKRTNDTTNLANTLIPPHACVSQGPVTTTAHTWVDYTRTCSGITLSKTNDRVFLLNNSLMPQQVPSLFEAASREVMELIEVCSENIKAIITITELHSSNPASNTAKLVVDWSANATVPILRYQ